MATNVLYLSYPRILHADGRNVLLRRPPGPPCASDRCSPSLAFGKIGSNVSVYIVPNAYSKELATIWLSFPTRTHPRSRRGETDGVAWDMLERSMLNHKQAIGLHLL